jgi:glycosyltransferase involved in cell wall biosynthesis
LSAHEKIEAAFWTWAAQALKLALLASHPIQYQAPLFRALDERLDLKVFFAHRATSEDQAKAGFGIEFDWDIDLLSGYTHHFLENVATRPGLDRFAGCDTPEISRRLAEGHFDAVLVQGWHRKSFLQGIFAAKRQGMPVLMRGDSHLETPRSMFKRGAKEVVYPAFLRLFDAGLYVGERSRAYWNHYHYPDKRLFFSPHCVDNEWFGARATTEARNVLRARLGIPPSTTVVLFAGKLVPFKRPIDLIGAAEQLKAAGREIAILVAGAGPLERNMANAADKAGVEFHGLGFCNQSEMPAAYAAADVLVLPSNAAETWGLVANEALACGRPIVLSDAVGAAPDLAMDGFAGAVFRMGDVTALTDALIRIIDHPPLAEAIGTKTAKYSLEAAANGIVHALGSVVKVKSLLD